MATLFEIRPIKPSQNTIVLHWNADRGVWRPLTWDMWLNFRFRKSSIVGLTGDHQFVVCVTGDDGEVCNIIAHRYRLDHAGLIMAHSFDELSSAEREAFSALNERYYAHHRLDSVDVGFTDAERNEFADYRERVARSYMPSEDEARALLRVLSSGLPKKPDWLARWFFDELDIDICDP